MVMKIFPDTGQEKDANKVFYIIFAINDGF